MKTNTMTVELTGITNLIMHNGRGADESDLLTVAKKLAHEVYKKNPTAENWSELVLAQMRLGVYFDEDVGVYLPEDNLRALMVKAGSGKKKKGMVSYKSAASTVNFDCEGMGFTLFVDGSPLRNLELFCKTKRFQFTKVVTNPNQRTQKFRTVRPMIPKGWTCEVTMSFRPDVIDAQVIVEMLSVAGLEVGLGDWRPSSPKPGPFGQFMITKIDGKAVE